MKTLAAITWLGKKNEMHQQIWFFILENKLLRKDMQFYDTLKVLCYVGLCYCVFKLIIIHITKLQTSRIDSIRICGVNACKEQLCATRTCA